MLEKKQVSKILDTMKERFPKADTTLEKTDPFHFLLSIILSAQATDVSVNKATPALFKAYETPADLAQADPIEVEKYIKTIGLYHNKAKYLVGCAKDLVERFDGKVPKTREELMSLTGVAERLPTWNLPNVLESLHLPLTPMSVVLPTGLLWSIRQKTF